MTKKKRIYQIDRRAFLRGLGASMVSLPMFDFFLSSNGTAFAQSGSLPKRYLLMMNGISLTRGSQNNNFLNPLNTGSGYDLRNGMTPIAEYSGLQDYISVLSNLTLPFTVASSSSGPPPGGYKGAFHNTAAEAQLTGSRTGRAAPSSDQLMRQAFNPQDQLVHMNYCVQPKSYLGSTTNSRSPMQFTSSGSRLDPLQSPRGAFNQLFFNLQDADPEAERQRRIAAESRKSVLDLISSDQVAFLKRELSPRDKSMLSDHFDQIRTLEQRLEDVESPTTATCQKPQDPGTDPAIGADYIGGDKNNNQDGSIAYSDENKRADIFIDLIQMAFACDVARHGTLRLTFNQSYMNAFPLVGLVSDYHEMSHGKGNTDQFIAMVRWHVSKYAALLDKLRKTPEGAGNLLDNSAILFLSEGGGGPNSDDGGGNSPHCGYNMTTLVGGRVGGLKPGVHTRTNEAHPSQVILTAMRAAGYQGSSLGEVSGNISELL